jgi:hypothetical protein
VRGEHGPDGEAACGIGDLGAGDAPLADQLGRPIQPAAVDGSLVAQLPGAMDLLGDVGEVEERRERAREVGGGRDIDLGQASRGGCGVAFAYEPAHLLHEIKQGRTLLAGKGLPEECAETADVCPQVRVEVHCHLLDLGRISTGFPDTVVQDFVTLRLGMRLGGDRKFRPVTYRRLARLLLGLRLCWVVGSAGP